MKPVDLVDKQFDLMRWWRSDSGRLVAIGFSESVAQTHYQVKSGQIDSFLEELTKEQQAHARKRGLYLAQRESAELFHAKSFFVSDEMSAFIEHAASKMPPQDLRREDLPCSSGFVWFQKPLYVADIRGERISVKAVRWALGHGDEDYRWRPGTAEDGVGMAMYSPFDDPADTVGYEVGHDWPKGIARPPVMLYATEAWEFGRDYMDLDWGDFGSTFDPETLGEAQDQVLDIAKEVRAQMLRLMAAFWALCQQTIRKSRPVADVTIHDLTRKQVRRLTRESLLTDEAREGVRVVTLRRARNETASDPTSTRHYSHRFVVNGFWRNQWYPSLNCHRRIYIDDYVKGPEDAPLIPKHTVYKLSR